MFISREKFEEMEAQLNQAEKDVDDWRDWNRLWEREVISLRRRYNTSESFADKLIEEKSVLQKENQRLKDSSSNLYADYLDTLDNNNLLQDSLSLSIEALGESQKQISILKQTKDILSDDLNKVKYERDYYKELYYQEGGY